MAKNKNNYFELMTEQFEFCVKASALLKEILENYDINEIVSKKEEMHKIEHSGDELYHDIYNRLSAEFITPIDQEDILHLVQLIDDITDAIDEVVLYLYMYQMKTLPAKATDLAEIVSKCINTLSKAIDEIKNFKKPQELRKYLVEVNNIESEADFAYAEAIHDLFKNYDDAKTLIGGKAILESMENCCDLCGHAAGIIEQIIIKNT